MARIRSIKPEFWTDGKTRRLSDTTALFFISLWNHCDDAGYFTTDSLELSMKLARWRSQDVKRLLSALHRAGLVRLSAGHGVGMVVSWSHQRIDKPRPSKWQNIEITWDEPPQFEEPSSRTRRKDRIGKDRRGEDQGEDRVERDPELLPAVTVGVETRATARDVKSRRTPAKTAAVWEAYSEAYAERFGQRPADNAMERKHLSRFVDMVGAHDAPSIAAFFIRHPNAYYIQKGYPTWLLAQDAQKLRTEWLTGNRISRAKAQETERAFDNLEAFGLVGGERGK